MTIISVTDHLGGEWELIVPMCFIPNRNGLMVMWALVNKGPRSLHMYDEIPLPVFIDWWE